MASWARRRHAADAEAARVAVQKIQKRLDELARKASATVKDKLRSVQLELQEAKQSLGIR